MHDTYDHIYTFWVEALQLKNNLGANPLYHMP